jgi:aryl-alcohol dehydrogenase-like predicted oxidoreductase
VERVETLAQKKRCTPAQLALAWILSRGPDIVPIPGSTRAERVEENAHAVSVELSREDLAALEPGGAAVAGERYPEGGMRTVNR